MCIRDRDDMASTLRIAVARSFMIFVVVVLVVQSCGCFVSRNWIWQISKGVRNRIKVAVQTSMLKWWCIYLHLRLLWSYFLEVSFCLCFVRFTRLRFKFPNWKLWEEEMLLQTMMFTYSAINFYIIAHFSFVTSCRMNYLDTWRLCCISSQSLILFAARTQK